MSLGDDGYGNGRDSGRAGGDHGDDRHLTRTRLPEGEGDPYGPSRRGGRGGRTGRPSRNLMTVVGVVVLLIAAIAFANRGGGDSASDDSDKDAGKVSARPTAPSGTKPVAGKTGGIASGFAHTEQGAQSAAANYAVALGGDGMFRAETRHGIVDAIHTPEAAPVLQKELDKAYAGSLFQNLGLNPDGSAPKGQTFVSRTMPIGSKATSYNDSEATVEVWCAGLVGLAGQGSTKPVSQTWFTLTQKLHWVNGDWKIASSEQKQGPAPVAGDVRASGADEITNAVNGYGGFTYAR
ncbi:hypothetical protein [Streptomyces sp. ISL-11]|uniref:hypothetical protein n=1 Tax=Streptomyces sp. ISL-11 TaxID=2819174 RepID=UPI001BEA78A3|nr:hypothetical protein [Streptomyces sp. ISL-11]MBT2386223.1 hypothetical protein [Streptomyces sp. ISL-11]